MMARRLFVFITIALILNSCGGDSPFITKEEAERQIHDINLSRDPFHQVQNVAAIINNDIYYFERLDSIPRKLTNTPGSLKTSVKVSSDGTRLAYINEDGNPVIISTSDGKTIETLTQYSYIDQMGWVRNSTTLFMLIDREVVLHGTSLSVIQPESFHPWDEVKSFSINSIGDQGYFIDRYEDLSASSKLQYHSTSKQLDEEYSSLAGETYDYIDFYDSNGNFLLGYKDPYSDAIQRIVCVENYNFFAAYEWDYEPMRSPEFHSNHQILLYGTVEDQGTYDEKYYIKGVYLGTEAYPASGAYDRLTTLISKYPSDTPIYLDWAQ